MLVPFRRDIPFETDILTFWKPCFQADSPSLESRVVRLHVVTGRIEAFIVSAGVDALLFAYVYGQCIVCDVKTDILRQLDSGIAGCSP